MQSIRNISRGPVKVRLPGGKVLFLGPGKTGEIADKALDHPGVKELVDQGSIEILGHQSSSEKMAAETQARMPGGSQGGHKPSSGGHSAGDR